MAISQPSWNGLTNESPRSHVRGRPISQNREASERVVDKPKLEFFDVFAGLASPEITISFGFDGKNIMLRGNRRDLMNMNRKIAEAIFKMEPGAPPDPHK